MPTLKNCRLQHIQDVLSKKKKVLKICETNPRPIPSWGELGVKNIYPIVIENVPEILQYLPDPHGKEQRLPERQFFYAVVATLYPEQLDNLIKEVEQ